MGAEGQGMQQFRLAEQDQVVILRKPPCRDRRRLRTYSESFLT
jgi:hypothetical protein